MNTQYISCYGLKWMQNPYVWIQSFHNLKKDADRDFSAWVRQVSGSESGPFKRALTELQNCKVITPPHLPWHMFEIFLTYFKDKIEIYQMQLDERDAECDNLWLALSDQLYAASYEGQIFPEQIKQFEEFINYLLKNSPISKTDKFIKIVNYWKTILKVPYLLDMDLISLIDKSATTKSEPITFKYGIKLEDLEKSFNSFFIHFKTEKKFSFNSLNNLIKEDYNPDLDHFLHFVTNYSHVDTLRKNDEISIRIEQVFEMINSLDFKSLDKNKVEKICKNLFEIIDNLQKLYRHHDQSLEYMKELKSLDPNEEITINVDNKLFEFKFHERRSLFTYLLKINRHSRLVDTRLISKLDRIHTFLIHYANADKHLLKEGFLPSDYGFPGDSHILTQKFSAKGKQSKKINKKSKAKKINRSTDKSQNQIVNKNKISSIHSHAQNILSLVPAQGTWMEKLYETHGKERSVYFEQALWHMERLLSIRSSLEKHPSLTQDMQLNILNAFASSSHKFLEQLYNYLLVKNDQSPLSGHNLKVYHSQTFPQDGPYPPVVKLLYNANNWTRYFYSIEAKLDLITTQNHRIPLLVKDFISLAANKWEGSLQERIQEIFNLTVEQGNALLFKGTPPAQIGQARDLVNHFEIKNEWNTDFVDTSMILLEKTVDYLDQNLNSSGDLYLKQAMASLKMLKNSLTEWNLSKDHTDLVTWSAWSLQQLQESLENTLRAVAELKQIPVTPSHELKTIATELNVDMEELGHDLHRLSWKPRYPANFREVDSKSAKIIDLAEALRMHPELEEGFEITRNPLSTRIWDVIPAQQVTTQKIGEDLFEVLTRGISFLNGLLTSQVFGIIH